MCVSQESCFAAVARSSNTPTPSVGARSHVATVQTPVSTVRARTSKPTQATVNLISTGAAPIASTIMG